MKQSESAFSKAMRNSVNKHIEGTPADRRQLKRIANALIRLVRKNQGKEYSSPQTAKNRRHIFKAVFNVVRERGQKIV